MNVPRQGGLYQDSGGHGLALGLVKEQSRGDLCSLERRSKGQPREPNAGDEIVVLEPLKSVSIGQESRGRSCVQWPEQGPSTRAVNR